MTPKMTQKERAPRSLLFIMMLAASPSRAGGMRAIVVQTSSPPPVPCFYPFISLEILLKNKVSSIGRAGYFTVQEKGKT